MLQALMPASVIGRWRACARAGLLTQVLAGCASAPCAQQGADASLVVHSRSRTIGQWTVLRSAGLHLAFRR